MKKSTLFSVGLAFCAMAAAALLHAPPALAVGLDGGFVHRAVLTNEGFGDRIQSATTEERIAMGTTALGVAAPFAETSALLAMRPIDGDITALHMSGFSGDPTIRHNTEGIALGRADKETQGIFPGGLFGDIDGGTLIITAGLKRITGVERVV